MECSSNGPADTQTADQCQPTATQQLYAAFSGHVASWVTSPNLGWQCSSRSDLSPQWFDRLPLIQPAIHWLASQNAGWCNSTKFAMSPLQKLQPNFLILFSDLKYCSFFSCQLSSSLAQYVNLKTRDGFPVGHGGLFMLSSFFWKRFLVRTGIARWFPFDQALAGRRRAVPALPQRSIPRRANQRIAGSRVVSRRPGSRCDQLGAWLAPLRIAVGRSARHQRSPAALGHGLDRAARGNRRPASTRAKNFVQSGGRSVDHPRRHWGLCDGHRHICRSRLESGALRSDFADFQPWV